MATSSTSTRSSPANPERRIGINGSAPPRESEATQDDPLHQVLKTYWGFDEYLPLQREAMQCVMEDRDSLVVMPTGGGKSLCFQRRPCAATGWRSSCRRCWH